MSWGGDVGVTQTPGSHSQTEKVAAWPSFHLSGCSKEKVSTAPPSLPRIEWRCGFPLWLFALCIIFLPREDGLPPMAGPTPD